MVTVERQASLASPARRAVARRSFPGRASLVTVGEMVLLLCKVIHSAVRHPRGYWGDVRDEMYTLLKRTWLPIVVTNAFFVFAVVILVGLILDLFGAQMRLGAYITSGAIRQLGPWINGMIVAGIMGASITADLGARRIREEIDALKVLGIDPLRMLVLPRVIGAVLLTGALTLAAIAISLSTAALATSTVGNDWSGPFWDAFQLGLAPISLVESFVKSTLFGLLIGVVCAYKGFNAGGGANGVGKAVNQAVVISFVGLYLLHYIFTTITLALFPDLTIFNR